MSRRRRTPTPEHTKRERLTFPAVKYRVWNKAGASWIVTEEIAQVYIKKLRKPNYSGLIVKVEKDG